MYSTTIIAEAGVNHNGDVGLAKELITVAAEAGADLVKFQTFKPNLVASKFARQAAYQAKNTGKETSQLDMIAKLELSESAHFELCEHAHSCGIGLFSTAFDLQSLNFLRSLKLDWFKVPSGEVTNRLLLEEIGKINRNLLLSTGMCTLGEVEEAINVLEESGTDRSNITVLHCTSEYPAAFEEVNLRAMNTLRTCFGTRVGYSDHTVGIEVAISAVARGASVIEKHFTLDKKMAGPDHLASIEPAELRQMISAIRNVEIALGDGIKKVTSTEMRNIEVARRSIVAKTYIEKGEVFSLDNLAVKRPGFGISPMRIHEVVGRFAGKDFEADELVDL